MDSHDDLSSESAAGGGVPSGYGPRTGRNLTILAGLAATALALGFLIVDHERAGAEKALVAETAVESAAAPIVDVVRAQPGPPSDTLTLPGEAQAWHATTIYARVDGYLAAWHVDIGDHVEKGQLLAMIDTPELDQRMIADRARLQAAQADLAVVQSNVAFAKQQYERWWNSPKGVVSEQEREEKKAAYDVSVARLNAAKAQVDLDQAAIGRVAAETEFRNVIAPFDGTITERRIDIGDLVTAGSRSGTTALYSITQTDKLRVFVDVPQAMAVELRDGTPCTIQANDRAGRMLEGKVTRTAGSIDTKARTLRVEVDIPNKDGMLLPGMYVTVTFRLKTAPSVQVPASAVLFRPTGPEVAVVDDSGAVTFRKVSIASDGGAMLQISSGLSAGDRVALNISSQIAQGDKVRAADADAPAHPVSDGVTASEFPARSIPDR